MRTRALFLSILGGCGGSSPATSEEAPRSVPALICSGRVPDDCGVSRAECEETVDPIVHTCAAEFRSYLPEDPTEEQMTRAMLVTTLCSIHVYRQRRALDGHACTGDDIPREHHRLCLLCSVAAGTVTIAEDREPVASEPAPAPDEENEPAPTE